MMQVHRQVVFSVLLLLAISPVHAASAGLGLTPGVSLPEAFLGQEPAAPAGVQEANNMKSRVEQLDKLLDQEHDALEKQSMNLQKQTGLSDSASGSGTQDQASVAQAMAMANQLRQGGGMQGMMAYMRYSTSDTYRERTQHWADRIREAQISMNDAENWLNKAKDQVKMSDCPDVTIGEATIKDEKCMKAAALEYSHKMQNLATSYLGKVSSAITSAMTATKVCVDANEGMAAKLNVMKGGPLLQTQVITLHEMSADTVHKYNELLRRAVDTATDVANSTD